MPYKPRICVHCARTYIPVNKMQMHCDRDCFLRANGFVKQRFCLICDRPVKWTGKRRKYCSRAHYAQAVRQEGSTRYRGGTVLNTGYQVRMIDGKTWLVHRIIMAEHLGRPLEAHEIVHHRDGNRLNNAIENLELLTSDKEHRTRHARYYRSEHEKECARCREVKPRSEFYPRHSPGRDPSRTECKACCALMKAAKKAVT